MGVACFDLTGGIWPEARLATCRVRLMAGDKVEVVFGEQRNDGGYEPSPELRQSITRMMSKVERVEYRRPDPARAGDPGEVIFHMNPHSLKGPRDGGGEDVQALLFDVTPRDPGYGPGRVTFAWYFDREPQLQPVAKADAAEADAAAEAAEAQGRRTRAVRDE